MDKNDKDKVEGFAQDTKGKAKEAMGDLRGDKDQQAEGQADQVSGKVKKGVADAKDKISDVVDDIKK